AADGYSAEQFLTISNTGGNPLYISSLALDDPMDFGIAGNDCPMAPQSLETGGNCQIALDFAPQSSGTIGGHLNIFNNSTATQPEVVALSGSVTACPVGQPDGPDAPNASPRLFYSGEDTQLTVSSAVPPDPNLIPGTITLLEVDSSGNQIAVLGQMYDDGTHGDVNAGDGVYTAQPTVNISTAGAIYLAVQAKYSGPPGCRQSNVNERQILVAGPRHSAAQDTAEFDAANEGAKLYYDEIANGIAPTQAAKDFVNHMQSTFPNLVSSVGSTPDGTDIWVKFIGGHEYVILKRPPNTEGGGVPAKDKSATRRAKAPRLQSGPARAKELDFSASQPASTPASRARSASANPAAGEK
ncbi:MAG TPA: choice-of-anchor X domain-containing protein, partial [Candidatus Binataceae bacterium]|nr:choice-of-anchor X domain-containing protein [Candidatus Binataceae bacterium]